MSSKPTIIKVRRGQVQLIRKLDQMPDMSKLDVTKAAIKKILKSLTKK